MCRSMTLALIVLAIGGWNAHVSAAPAVADAATQPSTLEPLREASTAAAGVWGLNDSEWTKFEQLRRGPRRYWSPQLDPLTTLGVEAETEQERQHYAELQVRLEARRAERELAYQQAYSAAWARLYPGLQPVQGMSSNATSMSSTRYAVFVEQPCRTCQADLQPWLKQGLRLDIYLVGSQGDDARLRQWARESGITEAQVNGGQVTLNHDRGRWFALGARRPLPARYAPVEGQWQRVD